MSIIITLLLVGVFLAAVILDQASRTLPAKELKRRARSGHDTQAANIYKMASYGGSLEALLWLVGSIAFGLLVIRAVNINSWLVVGVVLAASWIYAASRQYHHVGGRLWRLAAGLAPKVSWLLSHLQPVLGRVNLHSHKRDAHQNIFEKEDLVELLQKQIYKPHNRLSEADLKLAAGALTFSDKKVADIMQASADVKFIARDEPVGPLLMDELHGTGSKYFPVVVSPKAAQPEIVGTLYLKDIVMNADHAKVADIMKREVNYINEACSLHQVLNAFIKAQTHMFVVTNNFEEKIGVITIDKLLEQITGTQSHDDDFDRYDNLLAVAGMDGSDQPEKQPEAA